MAVSHLIIQKTHTMLFGSNTKCITMDVEGWGTGTSKQ